MEICRRVKTDSVLEVDCVLKVCILNACRLKCCVLKGRTLNSCVLNGRTLNRRVLKRCVLNSVRTCVVDGDRVWRRSLKGLRVLQSRGVVKGRRRVNSGGVVKGLSSLVRLGPRNDGSRQGQKFVIVLYVNVVTVGDGPMFLRGNRPAVGNGTVYMILVDNLRGIRLTGRGWSRSDELVL